MIKQNNKHSQTRLSFLIIFLIILSLSFYSVFASTLNCSFTSSCSDTIILLVKNDTGGFDNSHAQNTSMYGQPSQYPYSLCCSVENADLTTSCEDTIFLKLSNETNAHVQVGSYSGPYDIYDVNACLSLDPGNISCGYSSGSCPENRVCIASIASSEIWSENLTNSHVGSCDKYNMKICCSSNSPPIIELISPEDGSSTFDRTPIFTWEASDPDGDSLEYEFNISLVGSSTCSDSSRYVTGIKNKNYTLPSELRCLYDNNDYYIWSARACENATGEFLCSPWADAWKINISALVEINVINDYINFGNIAIEQEKNTTSGYEPILFENNGTVLTDVSINATQLWTSVPYEPSEYFQAKTRAYEGNATYANTSWFKLPTITGYVTFVEQMKYQETNKTLKMDVSVKAPKNEAPGNKSSIINFKASLAE